MNSRPLGKGCYSLISFAVILCCTSCIEKDESLGLNYLATNQKYDIYTAEFDLTGIMMQCPDSLSAYNIYKFTFGSVRDKTFGLSTRSCAFTLVPVADTLDFGIEGTQTFKGFHFAAINDSVSCSNPNQKRILQNVNVYELEEPVNLNKAYPDVKFGSTRVTDGVPVYTGTDSLAFDFSQEFGEKYMSITQSDLDTITNYTQRFPGIYICTDDPIGYGGRINMFRLPIDVYSGYIYGSYANLYFSAEYDGDRGVIDTSFVFYLGPLDLYDMSEVSTTDVSTYPQIAVNFASTSASNLEGEASDIVYFEGGRGVKPVIKAEPIREMVINEILGKTGSLDGVVISKASLVLPFEMPDDYTDLDYYPTVLSPTCRITGDNGTVAYASITDYSEDSEDQGDINRSTLSYTPDISHHLQEIIALGDNELDKIENYDIWLLAMADETVSNYSSSSSSSDLSDYYTNLLYNSYYNSLYSGYYSGYNSYYSNYYNYYYLSSLLYSSSSSSTTTTVSLMDQHRYYRALLNGPAASDNNPKLKIVYAVPRTTEE